MRARDESRKANRALCDAFRATLRFYEDWVEQADPAQAPSAEMQAHRELPAGAILYLGGGRKGNPRALWGRNAQWG